MITKKRIRSVDNHLLGIPDGEQFYIGVENDEIDGARLKKIGISEDMVDGEIILPSIVGPRSRFNSNGGFIKDKSKPKEQCSRLAIITDWHGYGHLVSIPYERYHRIPIPAPEIELTMTTVDGKTRIVSPLLTRNDETAGHNKHIVNLFLELFGYCSVLKKDFAPAIADIPLKRVNWQILPKGEYPWERTSEILKEFTRNRGKGTRRVMEHKIKTISNYKPSNVILGRGGFYGYWIFEFANKGFYLLESLYYGDATYVLGSDWEKISQFTKSEILNGELHKGRYIHTKGWELSMDKLLR